MGDCEYGRIFEFRSDCPLDKIIRLQVNGSSGLIQDEDFCFPEQSTCEADQLSLTHAEIVRKFGREHKIT